MRVALLLPVLVAAAANDNDNTVSKKCPEVLASPVWSAGSTSAGLYISADKSGCFTVSADGQPWLVSGATTISVDLVRRSNLNGTLTLVNFTTSHGSDMLGPYTRAAWEWAAPSMAPDVAGLKRWVTSIKAYTRRGDQSAAGIRTLVFGQTFGEEARGFPGSGQWGIPGSSFPSFDSTVGPLSTGDLATLTFHNQGDSRVSNASEYGSSPWGGMTGGVPLALFDSQARTAVLSPLESFLSTVFNQVEGEIVCGPEGRAKHIPAGHETAVILQYGHGISDTFLEWGNKLLHRHGKQRAADDANVQVERLGYSTVGHYFYGVTIGKTAEETMRDVAAYASELQLPYGWYLLDSWWYGEGSTPLPNGTSEPVSLPLSLPLSLSLSLSRCLSPLLAASRHHTGSPCSAFDFPPDTRTHDSLSCLSPPAVYTPTQATPMPYATRARVNARAQVRTCQQKATTTSRARQGHMALRGDDRHLKSRYSIPHVHTKDTASIGMMTRSRTSAQPANSDPWPSACHDARTRTCTRTRTRTTTGASGHRGNAMGWRGVRLVVSAQVLPQARTHAPPLLHAQRRTPPRFPCAHCRAWAAQPDLTASRA